MASIFAQADDEVLEPPIPSFAPGAAHEICRCRVIAQSKPRWHSGMTKVLLTRDSGVIVGERPGRAADSYLVWKVGCSKSGMWGNSDGQWTTACRAEQSGDDRTQQKLDQFNFYLVGE